MKVLVAGGTGFIGSRIIDQLLAEGIHQVACMSRRVTRENRWGHQVEMRWGNVEDADSLAEATAGMDVVIHCVQFPNHPMENPKRGWTYIEIDGHGTERMVAAARKNHVKRFVYFSGAGTAPDKPQPWFQAKMMAENAIRASGIEHVILRPSWIYGPEDRSLNKFLSFAKFLPFVPVIGNGKSKVQPISIFDVARVAALAVAKADVANQIFELGGPQTLTMDQIIKTALSVVSKKRFLFHQPVGLMKLAASLMSILPQPALTPSGIEFILMEEPVDPSKAEKVFGIKFMSLEEGLRKYLK